MIQKNIVKGTKFRFGKDLSFPTYVITKIGSKLIRYKRVQDNKGLPKWLYYENSISVKNFDKCEIFI